VSAAWLLLALLLHAIMTFVAYGHDGFIRTAADPVTLGDDVYWMASTALH
jgi:hypothetical protein